MHVSSERLLYHLSIYHLFILSICLLPDTYLSIIIVSIENMNTIQPIHLPVGSLAVAKVNGLGSLVGCLGVGKLLLALLTEWEDQPHCGTSSPVGSFQVRLAWT